MRFLIKGNNTLESLESPVSEEKIIEVAKLFFEHGDYFARIKVSNDSGKEVYNRKFDFSTAPRLAENMRKIVNLFTCGQPVKPGLYPVDALGQLDVSKNLAESEFLEELHKEFQKATEETLQKFEKSLYWVFPNGHVREIKISNCRIDVDVVRTSDFDDLKMQVNLFRNHQTSTDCAEILLSDYGIAFCQTPKNVRQILVSWRERAVADRLDYFSVHAARYEDRNLSEVSSKVIIDKNHGIDPSVISF